MTTDATQLLLIIILIVTTVLLVVIGIQIIGVLKELKQALGRINNIVNGIERVGLNLDGGLKEIGGFMVGIKSVLAFVNTLNTKKSKK
jgi:hypothetical protein